jgi:hypothetical protein
MILIFDLKQLPEKIMPNGNLGHKLPCSVEKKLKELWN